MNPYVSVLSCASICASQIPSFIWKEMNIDSLKKYQVQNLQAVHCARSISIVSPTKQLNFPGMVS